MKTKRQIAVVLGVLVLIALLTTSLVSARPLTANMTSHFQTIPGGSLHPSYNGDFVSGDHTIPLTSGWSTNLPYNTCAIAVRLAYWAPYAGKYAILQSSPGFGAPVQAITQVANQWINNTGIVPITGPNADVRLDISHSGGVYIEISGYWVCDDFVRPTPSP